MFNEAKERTVLQMLADGLEIAEICKALSMSPGKYYYFLALLRARHNAKNAAHLVAIGLRKKIIQ